MHRFIAISIAIISILSMKADDLPDFLPGRIVLAVDPSLETICYSGNSGFSTGISGIDDLLVEEGCYAGKYIVPWRQMTTQKRDRVFFMRNLYLLSLPENADIERVCAELEHLPEVTHAEPDYLMKNFSTATNDPLMWQQWHLRRIQAHWAWDYQRGSSDVIVSVFEGLDWAHPDLAELLWQNLGEDADGDGHTMEIIGDEWYFDPGDLNCIDDDGDGYIDDLFGWDFMDGISGTSSVPEGEDIDTPDLDPSDEIGLGHGTHCTGIVGAMTDNGIGISGLNWNTKLAALRTDFTYNTGGGGIHGAHVTDAVIEAMAYAIVHDIKVWSLSYGGNYYSGLMNEIIRNAWDSAGVVIAAGAGNDNNDELFYPAAYMKVMSVASTDDADHRSGFSNFGTWVDICAPGSAIYSTFPRHSSDGFGYRSNSGTSMATPVVAGVMALVKSEYPDSSNIFIYERVVDNTDTIPDEWYRDGLLGSGRVNAYKALYAERFPMLTITDFSLEGRDDGDSLFGVGETVYVHIEIANSVDWEPATGVSMHFGADDMGIAFSDTVISLPDIAPGGSIVPPETAFFVVGPGFIEGRDVPFSLRIETASGYHLQESEDIYIGTPELLIYARDNDAGAETYIEADLQRGNVSYYVWHYADRGMPAGDFIEQNFRYIVFEGGSNTAEPITAPEVELFEGFLDAGLDGQPNGLFLSGQYLADSPVITDFLSEYFATEHVSNSVSVMLGLTVRGYSGDPVTDGLELNVAYGSNCSGPQTSIGGCIPTGEGIPAMFYFGTTDLICATRNDAGSYRTFFAEWSLSGVSGSNPGRSERFNLVHNVLTWFGAEFTAITETHVIPKTLDIAAFPNPFNASCQINIPQGFTTEIYDIHGRSVHTLPGGTSIWNAEGQPSGVYLVRAQRGDEVLEKRVVLVR